MPNPPKVRIHLLKVGSCRHCERVTIRGGKLSSVTFPSLSALLVHPDHGPILMDTGYASHFKTATERFPERLYRWTTPVSLPDHQQLERQLARFGFGMADIGLCLITHFHADHIAGLADLPAARFVAMQADYAQISDRTRIGGLTRGLLRPLLPGNFESQLRFAEQAPVVALPSHWAGLGAGFDLLGDGSIIGVHLPGHSAGQMGLLVVDDSGREVLLCADACWSARAFREMRLPSFFTRTVMHDCGLYKDTLERLHHISSAHPDLVILPSHCDHSLAEFDPAWAGQ